MKKKQKSSRKAPRKTTQGDLVPLASSSEPAQTDFAAVMELIDAARLRAVAAVNTTLIELYWSIGELIQRKIADDGWGKGTVEDLAEHIRRKQPNARGFSAQNLWRMRQFFETYRDQPVLSTLLRELPWSHNLAIMSRCKRDDEREFYLRIATREHWSFRELERAFWYALSADTFAGISSVMTFRTLSASFHGMFPHWSLNA